MMNTVPILVVDDDANKRLAMVSALEPLGHRIVEADSGSAALRALMNQDFAVILLDVRMPIMDGFQTAALIRQRRQSEMTPIIFITSFGRDEMPRNNLYAEGAVDFIFAPVPPHELRAKVSVFAKIFAQAADLASRAREVKETADSLRLLTDAAPIGIFFADAQGIYTYTNPAWSQITGIPIAEAVGQRWDTFIGMEERAALADEFPGGDLGVANLSRRFTIESRPSSTSIVLLTSRSIPDARGNATGWIGTLADVTLQAAAEASMVTENTQLAEIALRDPLTGLGNRLALDHDLVLLEARARRYDHPYCLAMIDVDVFKGYNDLYGHQAGDEALKAVADELESQSRSADAVYRFGGEEFLCLLPEQSLETGAIAIERMRAAVEGLAIPHEGSPSGWLTISAGLGAMELNGTRPASEILKEADDALYRAKQLGRNRVELATAAQPSDDDSGYVARASASAVSVA